MERRLLKPYLMNAPMSLALYRALECEVLANRDFIPPLLDVGCGDGIFASVLFAEIGYPLRSRDVNMLGWRTRHPIPKAGSTTRAP